MMYLFVSILASGLLVATVFYRRAWLEEKIEKFEEAAFASKRINALRDRVGGLEADLTVAEHDNKVLLDEIESFKTKLAKIKELVT